MLQWMIVGYLKYISIYIYSFFGSKPAGSSEGHSNHNKIANPINAWAAITCHQFGCPEDIHSSLCTSTIEKFSKENHYVNLSLYLQPKRSQSHIQIRSSYRVLKSTYHNEKSQDAHQDNPTVNLSSIPTTCKIVRCFSKCRDTLRVFPFPIQLLHATYQKDIFARYLSKQSDLWSVDDLMMTSSW